MATIGILTGGGDCPGMNAVVRAVVRKGVERHGQRILGFLNGYAGLLDGSVVDLDVESTRGILHRGGTMLGTSRADPLGGDGGAETVKETMTANGVDGLIVVGGDGTLAAAAKLMAEGIDVIGVPKTIDNDIAATDYTFGFDTAVQIASDAIDRLHTTAESHNRVMILEVMGRSTGWIALYAGLAGGADVILIPERPFDIDEVCGHIRQRHARGRLFSVVVVAEGAQPQADTVELPEYELDELGRPKLGGISNIVAREIGRRTGFDARVTILGYVQRGGTPTATDRILATRFGIGAIDLAAEGRWGRMVALRGDRIEDVALDEAVRDVKRVPPDLYEVAEVFFG